MGDKAIIQSYKKYEVVGYGEDCLEEPLKVQLGFCEWHKYP